MIRKLRVPLLVVGADGSFAAGPYRVRRILIALDGSTGAEQAIGPAMALGGMADAEIMLLRVVPLSTAFGAISYRGGSGELAMLPRGWYCPWRTGICVGSPVEWRSSHA